MRGVFGEAGLCMRRHGGYASQSRSGLLRVFAVLASPNGRAAAFDNSPHRRISLGGER